MACDAESALSYAEQLSVIAPDNQLEPVIDADQMVAALMREQCRFFRHFWDVTSGRSEFL
jgi:hypothetical protein